MTYEQAVKYIYDLKDCSVADQMLWLCRNTDHYESEIIQLAINNTPLGKALA